MFSSSVNNTYKVCALCASDNSQLTTRVLLTKAVQNHSEIHLYSVHCFQHLGAFVYHAYYRNFFSSLLWVAHQYICSTNFWSQNFLWLLQKFFEMILPTGSSYQPQISKKVVWANILWEVETGMTSWPQFTLAFLKFKNLIYQTLKLYDVLKIFKCVVTCSRRIMEGT